jgi:hypothetical protein
MRGAMAAQRRIEDEHIYIDIYIFVSEICICMESMMEQRKRARSDRSSPVLPGSCSFHDRQNPSVRQLDFCGIFERRVVWDLRRKAGNLGRRGGWKSENWNLHLLAIATATAIAMSVCL